MPIWDEDWQPHRNPRHPIIQIGDDGSVRALVAPFDACIQDANAGPGVCLNPPRDGANYEYAMTGGTEAVVPMNIDHAPDHLNVSAASHHYANTGLAAMVGAYSEDEEAIWFEGEMLPGLTARDKRIIAAAALSGDWRWVEEEGRYRMIASQIVNSAGFRKARSRDVKITMTAGASMAITASAGEIPNALFSRPVITAGPDKEKEYKTGIMACLLPDADGARLSSLDLPHVTIVYGGKTDEDGRPDRDEMIRTARAFATSTNGPIEARISGAGDLGSEGAQVVFLEDPLLSDARELFDEFNRSDHAGFLPHMTVDYVDDDAPGIRAAAFPNTLKLNRIAVVWGEESDEFELGEQSPMAALAAALKSRLKQSSNSTLKPV